MRRARALLLAASAACAYGPAVHAQLPPNAAWRTFGSTHFRVTHEDGLDEVARHAAAVAERAHAALALFVADAPRGIIDIVVADNLDLSNGYATPFPSNRIVIYVKTPVDELELQYTRDWVELVVTHELAHIFHIDRSGAAGRVIRSIFGRVPATWPVFSAYASPRWAIEGLAVGVESVVTDFGRVHGSYNEMVVRTAALEDELDDFDRLSSPSPRWPGTARAYIYGSLFMDHLARTHGPDVTARLVRNTAGAIIPPNLWFGRVAQHTFGSTFRTAYAQWQRDLVARYHALAQELTAAGITATEPLTTHGGAAFYPRHSPTGERIAYAASDRRSPAHTRVLSAADGTVIETHVRTALAPSAWRGDELFTTDLEFTDPFHIYSDVRRAGGDRLTRGARLQDLHISPAGRSAVAVENGNATNRLVLIDLDTQARRAITMLDPDTHWSLPRFSPDGSRIAAGRWHVGGDYRIVVIDTAGRPLLTIDPGPGVAAAPAWSPDARWLIFSADRTGISNLYAVDVAGSAPHTLRQVTNVLTGAFFPDVSPDGRSIVFAAYHHDGYRLERIPFDPASWRAPMPAALAELAHQRGGADVTLSDSMSAASARADTTTAPAAHYRALRHLRPYFWVPTFQRDATRDAYIGVFTRGQDLVGRHSWHLAAAVDPSSGRTRGALNYRYAGLPSLPGLDLHPVISAALARDWETVLPADSAGKPYIEEREDVAALGLSLNRSRWRASAGLSASAELVRRARYVYDAPANVRLRDPADDLIGARVSTFLARYYVPPFAISPENGFSLQVSARRRSEREPMSQVIDGNTVVFDASYDELTTWNAAYLALPLPGFARHVIAARVSALHRTGPGAGTSAIGGASSTPPAALALLGDIAGVSRLLPVRGFDVGARRGTRAWTAAAEYRLPIAFITRSLHPLPIFLDRVSAAAFADAGHAWCSAAHATPACSFTSANAPALVSAGGELITHASIFGLAAPIRFGAAVPLQGADRRAPRFHLLFGSSF